MDILEFLRIQLEQTRFYLQSAKDQRAAVEEQLQIKNAQVRRLEQDILDLERFIETHFPVSE